MKAYRMMIKKWDIIIIAALILFSFLPFAVFTYHQANTVHADSELVAVISVDGKEIKNVSLTGHEGTETFDIKENETQYNTIEVKDNQIRVKAANCPEQIDVLRGFISKPGQTIVCLPHRLVIEVMAKDGENEEEMIISS